MRPPRHQSVWLPTKPSVFGNRYFGYSPKLLALTDAASRLEQERRLLLEWDGLVETFVKEPTYAVAFVDGRLRRSRIDFWVRLKSGEEWYEEVKYAQELGPGTRAQRQISIQKLWCASRGVGHRVVTDREIWQNPTLLNSLVTLFSEYDTSYPQRAESAISLFPAMMAHIGGIGEPTLSSVIAKFSQHAGHACARLCVFDLIRLKHVCANLENVRLSPNSKLRIK